MVTTLPRTRQGGLTPALAHLRGVDRQPMPPSPLLGLQNHIVIVLDRSTSMYPLRRKVIELVDAEVKALAAQSQELGQETRITIYSFGYTVECLVWDMDVMRLPSIKDVYQISGSTALIDGVQQAIQDLRRTPEAFTHVQTKAEVPYGDHAFLLYLWTDGEENASVGNARELSETLRTLPENWTVAAMVPRSRTQQAKRLAEGFGFPPGNVYEWDETSEAGATDAASTMRSASSRFVTQRATGVRQTTGLFTPDVAHLDQSDVSSLTELHAGQFSLYEVKDIAPGEPGVAVDPNGRNLRVRIDEFLKRMTGSEYVVNTGYYELIKPEEVQAGKRLLLLDPKKWKLYTGDNIRQVLGWPKHTAKVNPPAPGGRFIVFVQSTSINRNLPLGSRVIKLPLGL